MRKALMIYRLGWRMLLQVCTVFENMLLEISKRYICVGICTQALGTTWYLLLSTILYLPLRLSWTSSACCHDCLIQDTGVSLLHTKYSGWDVKRQKGNPCVQVYVFTCRVGLLFTRIFLASCKQYYLYLCFTCLCIVMPRSFLLHAKFGIPGQWSWVI